MIAYAFLGVAGAGVGLLVVAIRHGYGPVEAICRAMDGTGVRRLTARQLCHELRLARHELAGAGEYIGRLERDRRELSGELERITDQLHGTRADLDKAGLHIADLEEQLAGFDATCVENTWLRAALANATAMRQLLPGPSPADDASALPDHVQEFADQTATAWRASA